MRVYHLCCPMLFELIFRKLKKLYLLPIVPKPWLLFLSRVHWSQKNTWRKAELSTLNLHSSKFLIDQCLIGKAGRRLDEPNEAIISKRWALKYFGKEDARNEILKFDTIEYKVTAVMEDFPSNTDFPFDLILSYVTIKSGNEKVRLE